MPNKEASYVFATTVERGRNRFALGLPRLNPPSGSSGWEVCAISYMSEGLMVSWRCPARLQKVDGDKADLVQKADGEQP